MLGAYPDAMELFTPQCSSFRPFREIAALQSPNRALLKTSRRADRNGRRFESQGPAVIQCLSAKINPSYRSEPSFLAKVRWFFSIEREGNEQRPLPSSGNVFSARNSS